MGETYPFSFVQAANGLVQMRTYDGSVCATIDTAMDISDGTWHHVVGMRDGGRRLLLLFVDGVLVSSGADSTTGDLRNTGPLLIGRSHGSAFHGALDEVTVYDRLLTREEISRAQDRPRPASHGRAATRKRLETVRAEGTPAMRRILESWEPSFPAENNARIERSRSSVSLRNPRMTVQISLETGEITGIRMGRVAVLEQPGGANVTDVLTGARLRSDEGTVERTELRETPGKPPRITVHKRYEGKPYETRITYTLGDQALCCDVELQTTEATPRECRIEFELPVLSRMSQAFWTRAGAPFDLDDLPTELIVYRTFNMLSTATVLPACTFFSTENDVGLGLVAPFDLPKPGLSFSLNRHANRVTVSNYHLRLASAEPARAAVYIVPHEGCWRPSLAWMLETWPEYLRPSVPDAIRTPGRYRLGSPLEQADELQAFRDAGATWFQIHSHFPFYGLYMPDTEEWEVVVGLADQGKADLDKWERGEPQGGFMNGYDQMRKAIRLRQDHGMQAFLYFQSFELWDQYARRYLPSDIARNSAGNGLTAWTNCSLMNPDPAFAWGRHIAEQIARVPREYPELDGIFYDRDDYRDDDYAHDDGVSMDVDAPLYMLGFAQEQINAIISATMRQNDMGIWTNGPTSVEVMKGIDGIMCETNGIAAGLQYLGLARPMVLLPYYFSTNSYDTTPEETEEKMKVALSMGYFPSLTYGGEQCREIDARYGPLFELLGDREWVLSPRPLELPDGMDGNIFRSPTGDYVVTVVDFAKSMVAGDPVTTDLQVTIRVDDADEIRRCRVVSGDGLGESELPFRRDGNRLHTTLPQHLTCSAVVFAKDASATE
jgi:hypothetical protein